MPNQEFSGETIEDAIAYGLSQLGLARAQVEIELLDAGDRQGRPARVRLKELARRQSGLRNSFSAGAQKNPDMAQAQKDAEEVTMEILKRMGFHIKELKISVKDDKILGQISVEEEDVLVAQEGAALEALQYLVSRIASQRQDARVKVQLNCGNFRQLEEEKLAQQAKTIAEEVRQSGQPQALSPMDAASRRVIHQALVDDPDVQTESQGLGFERHIVIKPRAKNA